MFDVDAKYQIVDKKNPNLIITSVIICKENVAYQSIMVIYKDSKSSPKSKIKVFS